MPAKNNRTGNHFHDFSNHCKSPKSRMNGGGGTHFHRTNNGSGGKQSNRSKRGYSLSPKNIPPVPPPPKISTPSSSELAESRKHLKGKHVLRKNCILSSLPRSRYPSLAHIREFFERFGKISIIVEAPTTSTLWDNACKGSSVSKDDNQVFIAFHNEKMAQLALRETNDKVFGKKRNKIKSCHAHVPYCNEFLNGRSCKDINCIHLHEDLSLSTSLSPVSSDFKTNFKTTTPTLLRKKKSESSTSTCVWGNTTKTFLEATKNSCSQLVKPTQEIEVFQEARDEEVMESDDDSEDSNGFQLIETPDSTLTKSTYSSVLTCDTSFKTVESTNTVDKMELVLPPKKLFDADKGAVKMITNPFDIQSPWQLPKDGFAKLKELPKNLTYVPKKEEEKEPLMKMKNVEKEHNVLESQNRKDKATSDLASLPSLKVSTSSHQSHRRPLSSKNQNLASPRIPNYEQLLWRNRVSSPYYYHAAAFNFHPMAVNRVAPYWYHQQYPYYSTNYHQQYYLWRNRPLYY